MSFLIDFLIGIALLALCYIILVIIVKLPELPKFEKKINYTLVVFLAINVIAGIVGAIILLFSWFV